MSDDRYRKQLLGKKPREVLEHMLNRNVAPGSELEQQKAALQVAIATEVETLSSRIHILNIAITVATIVIAIVAIFDYFKPDSVV